MKNLTFIIVFLMSVSCVEDPEYLTEYKIINSSDHVLKFDFYSQYSFDSFELLPNGEKNFENYLRGSFSNLFPFEMVDSIKVTFDSSVEIYHGSSLYTLNRDLLNPNSYTLTTDDTEYRQYQYVFSNTDYQEALEH